jgi:hypothetical protein
MIADIFLLQLSDRRYLMERTGNTIPKSRSFYLEVLPLRQFQAIFRMSPETLYSLAQRIETHPVFAKHSWYSSNCGPCQCGHLAVCEPPLSSSPHYSPSTPLTGFFTQFFTRFFTHSLICSFIAHFPASQFFLPSFVIDLSRNSWLLFASFSVDFACFSGHVTGI